MLKLVKYLKPYVALIFVAVVLLGIQVLCDLSLPNYMSDIVNQGIAKYQAIGMDTNKSETITNTGLLMLLFTLISAACTVLVGLIAAKVSAGLSMDLRRKVFTKVESFSNREFDRFSTSSLITRTTNDITQIQMVVFMVIRMMIYAPLIGVGGAVMALQKSTSMSWMLAVAVIILVGVILTLFSFCLPKFKIVQKLTDKLNLVTRESLSGMLVIRAFNTQKFEEKRFDAVNSDITKTNLFVSRAMAALMPAITLIMNGMSLLIVWVGGHQIAQSGMQVGDMMAFMQYAMQIFSAFIMISMLFIMLPRASISAQRISEVIDTDLSIKDPERPEAFTKSQKGTVEFRNVHFRYHGAERDALSDISFTALPGQTTAIIGSAGSGKTTLVNLIPRFYDVTEGEVLVDGIDVRKASQQALRDLIGYVPQKSSLFKGTVKSNLKYADANASEDTLQKAAEISQSTEFIASKPEGFETEIAQGGKNVSGGQKQRLSIARALVKNPEILIFDDSFSALDFKTDSLVRKALNAETENSTVILIAQRISSIMNADQIIVLEEGRIVGKGRHDELMKTCETYREIALSQLSKEELA